MNGRLLCYVRGFTQLPKKRKAATYFEGPGGHGRPLLDGSYVTQRVRLAYSKPGTSTGQMSVGENKAPGHWEHSFVISGLLRDNKTHGTNLFFFFFFFFFLSLSSNIGFGIIAGRLAASTIALKAYSYYTTGPIDSILGRKHRGDL